MSLSEKLKTATKSETGLPCGIARLLSTVSNFTPNNVECNNFLDKKYSQLDIDNKESVPRRGRSGGQSAAAKRLINDVINNIILL